MNKKSMKTTQTQAKTKVNIAEKIGVLLMMAGAVCLAVGLVVGLIQRPESTSILQRTAKEPFEDFRGTFGDSWEAEWRSINQKKLPSVLNGGSIDIAMLLSSKMVGKDNIDMISRQFLSEQKDFLQLDIKNLKIYRTFTSEGESVVDINDIQIIHYQQHYQDIPVHNALVTVAYNSDKLVYYKSSHYPGVTADTVPTLSKEAAIQQAKDYETGAAKAVLPPRTAKDMIDFRESMHPPFVEYYPSSRGGSFKGVSEDDLILQNSTLEIYPLYNQGVTNYRLAWRLEFELIKDPLGKPVYYLDAHNGNLLAREDRIFYRVATEYIRGTVTGLIYPEYPNAGSEIVPFFNNEVGVAGVSTETDSNGQYFLDVLNVSQMLSSELKGSYVDVDNASQDDSLYSVSLTPSTIHNWNWQDIDTSYQYEEENVFYHVNVIHDYFTRGYPFDINEMDFSMKAIVSEYDVCNAYATGDEVHFFQAGDVWGWGFCEATSLGSDIIYHEYTHNVTEAIYGPGVLEYFGESGAMHEGYSDYYAASILDRSTIGDGIFPEVLRDLNDNKHYPEDIVGEVHDDSLIFSGALWDVRKRLGAEVTDALVIQAEKLYPFNFSEFLDAMLVVDDNDGDLTNGTPHVVEICDSFTMLHGIWSDYCIGNMSLPAARIQYPEVGSVYGKDTGEIEVIGVAYPSNGGNFQSYAIEYGRGENPDMWHTEGVSLFDGGSVPKLNEPLATLDVPTDTAGYTIRLSVTDSNGLSSATTYITTGLRAGWPKDLGHWTFSAPAAADIDFSYPGEELLITSWNNKIWAFHADGTLIDGWPPDIGNSVPDWSSIAVADIDPYNENGLETVVGTIHIFSEDLGEDKLYVIAADGSHAIGWPKAIYTEGMTYPDFIELSPSIADIDNNPLNGLEIIIGTSHYGAEMQVLAFHADGTLVDGWPQEIYLTDGMGPYISSPSIADIDPEYSGKEIVLFSDSSAIAWHSDGTYVPGWPIFALDSGATAIGDIDNNMNNGYELVTGSLWDVQVRSSDGSGFPGWPQEPGGYIYNYRFVPPTIGDVDSSLEDGLEIVTGAQNRIFVWNYDGSKDENWPQSVNAALVSSPLIVDLDTEVVGHEIVVVGWNHLNDTSYIFAFHADGTPVDGWPLAIKDKLIQTTPVISDIDGNGSLELIINYAWGEFEEPEGYLAVFDLPYASSPSELGWPGFLHDKRNTGFYNQCGDFTEWGECNKNQQYCDNGSLEFNCHYCDYFCPNDTPYCNPAGQCEVACSDGTPFGQCNNSDRYCDNGTQLPYQCGVCGVGCPTGYSCDGGQCCRKVGGSYECNPPQQDIPAMR